MSIVLRVFRSSVYLLANFKPDQQCSPQPAHSGLPSSTHTLLTSPGHRYAALVTGSSCSMAGLVQQAVEQSVLRVAKQLEDQIDSQLHKLENLQDDDLERIRQRRVQELRQQQEKTKEWVAKGHGEYKEIFDEKDFFKEMKGEERMICHFYRDNWPCKVGAWRVERVWVEWQGGGSTCGSSCWVVAAYTSMCGRASLSVKAVV